MKNLFVLLFTISASGAFAQTLTINGKAPAFKDGDTLSLKRFQPRRLGLTKPFYAKVQNGTFSFILNQRAAECYTLSYHNHDKSLFLDAGNVSIEVADTSLKNVIVSKNTTNDDYNAFNFILNNDKQLGGFYTKRASLIHNNRMDDSAYTTMKPTLDSLLAISKRAAVNDAVIWVKAHPYSQINAYVLNQYAAGNSFVNGHMPDNDLRALFASLPDTVKQNSWGLDMQDRVNGLFIGSHAPDFAEASPDGRIVKLSDYKGKYILLDFWASWCKPCRAENPDVAAAYQKFKSRNFEILSVSLDNNKASWIKAINSDGMPWVHVSDLKLRNDHVSVQYYVSAIPANFLIDPNGVIIAKNLHGNELQKALDTFIK